MLGMLANLAEIHGTDLLDPDAKRDHKLISPRPEAQREPEVRRLPAECCVPDRARVDSRRSAESEL